MSSQCSANWCRLRVSASRHSVNCRTRRRMRTNRAGRGDGAPGLWSVQVFLPRPGRSSMETSIPGIRIRTARNFRQLLEVLLKPMPANEPSNCWCCASVVGNTRRWQAALLRPRGVYWNPGRMSEASSQTLLHATAAKARSALHPQRGKSLVRDSGRRQFVDRTQIREGRTGNTA